MMLLSLIFVGASLENPKVFAEGIVSTAEFESHLELEPDGKTMYFVKSTPQFSNWRIYTSKLEGETWSKPEPAPFSGKDLDADPFITADGKRFFFISNRPHPEKNDPSMDIWVMDREGKGWSEPKRLGPEVNSETDEWYPTMDREGTLYFGSGRKGSLGGTDIWRSKFERGMFQKAMNLGTPINSNGEEIEPFITPDGKRLIFNAVRKGGAGGLDFYVSNVGRNGWSEPERLPNPPNSPKTELAPKLSRDGKRFYFTGIREGRLADILWMDAKTLGL